MKITINAVRRRQRANSYMHRKKNCETFLDTKRQTLFQNQDTFRYVFIYKKQDTLLYGVFIKKLKLVFIYKKNDTLRYVTFLYTKIQTLR